jgi:hypothetical protein
VAERLAIGHYTRVIQAVARMNAGKGRQARELRKKVGNDKMIK